MMMMMLMLMKTIRISKQGEKERTGHVTEKPEQEHTDLTTTISTTHWNLKQKEKEMREKNAQSPLNRPTQKPEKKGADRTKEKRRPGYTNSCQNNWTLLRDLVLSDRNNISHISVLIRFYCEMKARLRLPPLKANTGTAGKKKKKRSLHKGLMLPSNHIFSESDSNTIFLIHLVIANPRAFQM